MEAVERVLAPLDRWAFNCHGASATLVQSGVLGDRVRVARGWCENVIGQHSWVVCGWDCYDPRTPLIDPTLWSYDDEVEGIWTGTLASGKHVPHGSGRIWDWGRPDPPTETPMELNPSEPFSQSALDFLEQLGPLDERGWIELAHAPVEGWPAAEILNAIVECVGPFVPMDILGMLNDDDPTGLYLPKDAVPAQSDDRGRS